MATVTKTVNLDAVLSDPQVLAEVEAGTLGIDTSTIPVSANLRDRIFFFDHRITVRGSWVRQVGCYLVVFEDSNRQSGHSANEWRVVEFTSTEDAKAACTLLQQVFP